MQKPLYTHPDISSGERCLNIGLSLHLHPYFCMTGAKVWVSLCNCTGSLESLLLACLGHCCWTMPTVQKSHVLAYISMYALDYPYKPVEWQSDWSRTLEFIDIFSSNTQFRLLIQGSWVWSGPGPHTFIEIDNEIFLTVILLLPMIQERLLLVTQSTDPAPAPILLWKLIMKYFLQSFSSF